MNTLKINIPEGYKVDTFDTTTGEIKFAPIPKVITDRIKSFDDVLDILEIDKADFEKSLHGLTPDEAAYRKVKLITEALNEGWKPEWDNDKWDKWYPWFYMPNSSGSGFAFRGAGSQLSSSYAGSRLCFKSNELAKYAANTFLDIYKEFFTA